MGRKPGVQTAGHYLVFFLLFSIPLFLVHATLISLPYFWDELGQFVPTALDIYRHGWWIARSVLPNVHPPGVEAYLALWYLIFGYSIAITRVAMLLLAALSLLLTFLVAIQLSRGERGTPAFLPPVLLFVSPLFFMQAFLAQLDMPAMLMTLLALWLFFDRRLFLCAIACTGLLMAKETGIATVAVLFCFLLWRRQWKDASFFFIPFAALAAWLVFLKAGTGNWLGNPEFAHYNVGYSLHPVRIAFTFARRFYYLFIAEFRWVGTLALAFTFRSIAAFRTRRWHVALFVAAANIILVSVLGGAELERYLLPVLPLLYIAFALAFSSLAKWQSWTARIACLAGLTASIFWNPPYPFPYENNWAMVDFVRLQGIAADFADRNFSNLRVATAWPYTAALRHPEFSYVTKPLNVVETGDFNFDSVAKIPPSSFDALIVYTRTWTPESGWIRFPIVQRFLSHFYQWQPQINDRQCAQLGLHPILSWDARGQRITIYTR